MSMQHSSNTTILLSDIYSDQVRAVLDLLNSKTTQDQRFFAGVIEFHTIGSFKPIPSILPVSVPNTWTKQHMVSLAELDISLNRSFDQTNTNTSSSTADISKQVWQKLQEPGTPKEKSIIFLEGCVKLGKIGEFGDQIFHRKCMKNATRYECSTGVPGCEIVISSSFTNKLLFVEYYFKRNRDLFDQLKRKTLKPLSNNFEWKDKGVGGGIVFNIENFVIDTESDVDTLMSHVVQTAELMHRTVTDAVESS